jgi:hypothetical protein
LALAFAVLLPNPRSSPPILPQPVVAAAPSWVCLSGVLRREVVSERVSFVPDTATILLHGQRCYFLDRGDGRYEVRPAYRPPEPGEWIVTDGAFLLKSELLR